MTDFRKELPTQDDDKSISKEQHLLLDKYRQQYKETVDYFINMYPNKFSYKSGNLVDEVNTDINNNKYQNYIYILSIKPYNYNIFIIPSFGDIFNYFYIPIHVKNAKLLVSGLTVTTWHQDRKNDIIHHNGNDFYKVKFISPAMFNVSIPYGVRFIELSNKCNKIYMENILISNEEHRNFFKKKHVMFIEHDCEDKLIYMADSYISRIKS